MLTEGTEEGEGMREWTTIADTVVEKETMNPSFAIDQGKNYREFAVYVDYKANEQQATSGYIRVSLTDTNGLIATVQTTAGIPKTGYYRCVFHVILGSVVNLFDVKASTNTSLAPTPIYETSDNVLSAVKKLNILSYANIGVGSIIKIMAR